MKKIVFVMIAIIMLTCISGCSNSQSDVFETVQENAPDIQQQLIELAFGIDFDAYDRAIDTHIKNLRRKMEIDPHSPKYIKTVHGLGYRFEVKP